MNNTTNVNTKNLTSLAQTFLNSTSDKERAIIRGVVSSSMKKLEFKTGFSALKNLGISYLLGRNSSSKMMKGIKQNYDSYVLYLSASNNSGFDLCSFASKFCRDICLVESGRTMMEKQDGKIHTSRLKKTWLLEFNRAHFDKILQYEIDKAYKRNLKTNIAYCIRLNGTSDCEFNSIIESNNVQFYDYTKNPEHVINASQNHHHTFSFSGSNIVLCKQLIKQDINIAVPVLKSDFSRILSEFRQVYNGDETDLRFLDKMKGGICLLSVKGRHKDISPFLLDFEGFKALYSKLGLN